MTDARNQGHGHVTPRTDGVKARCGGPAICRVCMDEKALLEMALKDARDRLDQAADAAIREERREASESQAEVIPDVLLPLPDPDVVDIGRFGLCWREESVLAYGRMIAQRYEAQIADLRVKHAGAYGQVGGLQDRIAALEAERNEARQKFTLAMDEVERLRAERESMSGGPLLDGVIHRNLLRKLADAEAERDALRAKAETAGASIESLAEEIERLQRALAFWMPDVPAGDHPLQARIAQDAYLLVGYDGPCSEPSAYARGFATLTHTRAAQEKT